MGNTWYMTWEPALMENLQNTLGDGAIGLISHLSVLGEPVFLILIVGFFYWGYDKACGIAIGHCVLLNNVLCAMVKNVFLRRRPYFDHEGVEIYRPVEPEADIHDVAAQGFSFPSGHSSNSVAVLGSLAHYTVYEEESEAGRYPALRRIFVIAAVLLPFLVGFSRVSVGAHYPTDVLCGWAFGAVLVFLIPRLRRALGEKRYGICAAVVPSCGILFCRSEDFYSSLGLLYGFLAARIFESCLVHFEGTKDFPRILLRMTGGLAIFVAMNALLKLPFPADFLESGTKAALFVRTLRYTVDVFLVMGVYPMVFGRIPAVNRLFEKAQTRG